VVNGKHEYVNSGKEIYTVLNEQTKEGLEGLSFDGLIGWPDFIRKRLILDAEKGELRMGEQIFPLPRKKIPLNYFLAEKISLKPTEGRC
jgi:hypothetical protein